MSVVDNTDRVFGEFMRRAKVEMMIAGNVAVDHAVQAAPKPGPDHPYSYGDLSKGIFSEVKIVGMNIVCRVIDSMEYADDQERGPAPGSKRKWKFTPHMRPMVDYMQTRLEPIMERAVLGQ